MSLLDPVNEKELVAELAKQLPGAVALLKDAVNEILEEHEVEVTVKFKRKETPNVA